MSNGRLLYELYRRHEPDATAWPWLDNETRRFWETLALMVPRG